MALKLHTTPINEVPALTPYALTVSELETYADEIIACIPLSSLNMQDWCACSAKPGIDYRNVPA